MRRKKVDFLAGCLFTFLPAMTPAYASEGEGEDHASVEAHSSAEAHDADGSEHSFHQNTLGVFVGITHAGRRENGPAIGLEYSRRFNQHFSIGGIAEYTGGDADLWVAAIPFVWHLDTWKLYVAPGVEDGHHGTEELVRLGVEYAFELKDGWEIAPQINVDLVDGDQAWVFGVLFARGF
jgi:hypothetical protein